MTAATAVKYNIASEDDEITSVTVFLGSEQLIATPSHTNFEAIIDSLTLGSPTADQVREMFDLGQMLSGQFARVSERVLVSGDRLLFDGQPMDDVLTKVALAFHSHARGAANFQCLVNFMEKIETNPNQHSRQHLFGWLATHNFGIAPDGDFIAYKGVSDADGELKSVHSGQAIVNGVVHSGRIPNKPGTIIEMPRNEVQHAPGVPCSTGLHVANFDFARGFASGGVVLRVKVNPRDVVSVPTDSGGDKMRVCRYKVVDIVTSEDSSMLFVGDPAGRIAALTAPPKPKRRPKPANGAKPNRKPRERVRPAYYEEFTKADFELCPMDELRFVAKEFEVKMPRRGGKAALIPLLVKVGRQRRKTW